MNIQIPKSQLTITTTAYNFSGVKTTKFEGGHYKDRPCLRIDELKNITKIILQFLTKWALTLTIWTILNIPISKQNNNLRVLRHRSKKKIVLPITCGWNWVSDAVGGDGQATTTQKIAHSPSAICRPKPDCRRSAARR